MKGKTKEFIFLDPTVAKTRRNRVQFMLDDSEYATLEAAAGMQGTKAGELAGAIFRKHVLPSLSEEVRRLHDLTEPHTEANLDAPSLKRSNTSEPKLPIMSAEQASADRQDISAVPSKATSQT